MAGSRVTSCIENRVHNSTNGVSNVCVLIYNIVFYSQVKMYNSTKFCEIIEQLGDSWLLRDSVSWSYIKLCK
jgi:hypothetical protein